MILPGNNLANIIKSTSTIPSIREPSPTEPNTPSDEDDSPNESQGSRKSFSSLINYDPSSQPQPQHSNTTHFLKTISRAELLRLRLRVAMYKVRTNQIAVPFPDLQVPAHLRAPTQKEAVEEAVAELRREAQARQRPAPALGSIPNLQPAPLLRPTAYSSRMISERHVRSSPPRSRSGSPERLPSVVGASTPQAEAWRGSSPPAGGWRVNGVPESELTSSVVKGRVAEGLLGLRHAG